MYKRQIFAVKGVTGGLAGASMKDLLGVIGTVIVVIVSLSLFVNVVSYTNTLIGAVGGEFEETIYGIIPLLIYVGIIAAAGWSSTRVLRKK